MAVFKLITNVMKLKVLLLLVLTFTLNLVVSVAVAVPKIVVTGKDKVLLQEKLDKFSKDSNLSTGELVLKIGNDFMGTPYVGNTLDRTVEEDLVVNLRELDCTTFAENCLAIARTIKNGKPTFESFTNELEKIRYRNGKLNGYVSRLHYFGEWITNNAEKGIVEDVSSKIGGVKCPIFLNFMGIHPDSYPQLKANPALIKISNKLKFKYLKSHFFIFQRKKLPAANKKCWMETLYLS